MENTKFIDSQRILRNDSTENRRFVQSIYDVGALKKINPKRVVAITLTVINTPLPTISPITNPLLYKYIMRFNVEKFVRKIRSIKMAIGKISYKVKTQINRKVYKPIKLLLFMENTNTKKFTLYLRGSPNLNGTYDKNT